MYWTVQSGTSASFVEELTVHVYRDGVVHGVDLRRRWFQVAIINGAYTRKCSGRKCVGSG